MKLSQFRFDLPLNLIAQYPTKKREDARMMVVHRETGQIENRHFRDIMEYFDDKDVFVVNNTKVFPARMYGRKEKTGAKIEAHEEAPPAPKKPVKEEAPTPVEA